MNVEQKYISPKLYFDCEQILHLLYTQHKKIDKTMRIVILEKDIYPTLLSSMKLILDISFNKNAYTKEKNISLFDRLLYDSYIIQSQFTFLLLNNNISPSFYENISIELENYQKQLQGWKKYIIK